MLQITFEALDTETKNLFLSFTVVISTIRNFQEGLAEATLASKLTVDGFRTLDIGSRP